MKKVTLFSLLVACIIALQAFRPFPPTTAPKTKAELGEKLFFEKLLSLDTSISCASCHKPEHAFADDRAFSRGVNGKLGKRNTPSVMNMASRGLMFFDGRAKDLADQAHFPVEDGLEMNLPFKVAVARLNEQATYKTWFEQLYGAAPNAENVADAIARFERTLETSNTLFDNYMANRQPSMSESAIRGRALFLSTKSKCFNCHFSPDFTGDEFKNIGLYDGKTYTDVGRFAITKDSTDLGKFKVPGLRNVAMTAPYMHNGQFKTLREVIDYYDNPYLTVANPINIDTAMIKPLNLSETEKQDLENFLLALTDKRFL